MNNTAKINDLLTEKRLHCGRMVSGNKIAPKGQLCIWNANIVTRSGGKVWFGDLNLTKEASLLNEVADLAGEPLYILREMDARFENEGKPVEEIIPKAVWSTNTPVPTRA